MNIFILKDSSAKRGNRHPQGLLVASFYHDLPNKGLHGTFSYPHRYDCVQIQ